MRSKRRRSWPDQEEDVEGLEGQCLDHEEDGCPDGVSRVGEEGAPTVAWRPGWTRSMKLVTSAISPSLTDKMAEAASGNHAQFQRRLQPDGSTRSLPRCSARLNCG